MGQAALPPRLMLWECEGLILPCCLIAAQSCKPLPRGNTIAALEVKYSSLSFNDIYLWEGESITLG